LGKLPGDKENGSTYVKCPTMEKSRQGGETTGGEGGEGDEPQQGGKIGPFGFGKIEGIKLESKGGPVTMKSGREKYLD